MKPHLETDRLRLRPFRSDDLESMVKMFSDPEAMQFVGGPRTRAQCLSDLQHHVATWELHEMGPLAMLRKCDDQLIGRVGLWPCQVDDVVESELGYIVARAHWGCGYATEGAGAVLGAGWDAGLNEVVALIHPENERSRRVIDKLFFTFDKQSQVDGTIRNVYRASRSSPKAV